MSQITSGAAGHGWCTILGRAWLEGPLSQLFHWKTTPRPICPKLTGDLSHGRGCLPWRWQVPTTIPQGAVQVWVNVPNHIRGHQLKNEVWLICSKLTGDLPNSRGCFPWRCQVPTTILWGAVQVWVNVPNHVRSRKLKNKGWLIYSKFTGDLPDGRGCLPWRWQVPTTIPWGAVQVWVNVPNHIRSHQLKNEGWLICSKFTGDLPDGRGCFPWRWQVPTTIPWWALQVWVNVPNHVRSCQLKMKVGQSTQNSQGTCLMVGAAFPEDGKSLPPSLDEQYKCE